MAGIFEYGIRLSRLVFFMGLYCLTWLTGYYKITMCLCAVFCPVNGTLTAVLQQGGKTVRTTFMPKAGQIERSWYIIDAAGKPLGRVASEIARILRGKHKPIFTPSVDTGDHVVVINAGKVVLTGKKAEQKFHYRHSGYPGGLRKISYGALLSSRPERVMMLAVKGMLPHNRLGRAMLRKVRVYDGVEHPHEAQQPVAWKF